MGFPRKNTGVCCHFLLQGIFQPRDRTPTSCTGRWILYHCQREAFEWYYLNEIIFQLNTANRNISVLLIPHSLSLFSGCWLIFNIYRTSICWSSPLVTFSKTLFSAFMQKLAVDALPNGSGLPPTHLYCRASRSAVALDSYFPTSMLSLSALLLHSSRVMVRRSFWDLRCSIRLERKENHIHNFTLGLQCVCQDFSHPL